MFEIYLKILFLRLIIKYFTGIAYIKALIIVS